MSITRREFLLGFGSGLVLPAFFDRVSSHFQNHSEPWLEAPPRVREDLFAGYTDEGLELSLGQPAGEIPRYTFREAIDRYFGGDHAGQMALWGQPIGRLDQQAHCDYYFDHWFGSDYGPSRAYDYLFSLDLCDDLPDGLAVGGLRFVNDSNLGGTDICQVLADDEVTLSLLQQRLNELGTGIRVRLA